MLNVAVPQIILDQPGVRPLVGEREAAGMAQHVRVGGHVQPRRLAITADRQPGGLAGQRAAPLADKQRLGLGLHPRPLRQPGAQGAQLVGAERVRGGQPALEPGDVQRPALKVQMGQGEAARFRHAQAVAEHQQQQAAVAGLVAAALGGGDEPLHFALGQVAAVVFERFNHFVQCLGVAAGRKPACCLGRGFEH